MLHKKGSALGWQASTQDTHKRGKRRGRRKQEKKNRERERERKREGEWSDWERKKKARKGSFVIVNRSRNAPDLAEEEYSSPGIWSIFTSEGLGNTRDQNCLSQETKRCSQVEVSLKNYSELHNLLLLIHCWSPFKKALKLVWQYLDKMLWPVFDRVH